MSKKCLESLLHAFKKVSEVFFAFCEVAKGKKVLRKHFAPLQKGF